MTNYRKSLQSRDRRFVIPPGSQVVLLNDLPFPEELEGGAIGSSAESNRPHVKKAGTVGVVMAAPPNNNEPYLVRFADQKTAMLKYEGLSLRREEIESMLAAPQIDWKQYIVYRCRVGSRAYGLASEGSDDDIRGFFLPPAELHWSLYSIPEQIEQMENGEDTVYWELEKYIRLALKANPNVLETLWTPCVLQADPIAEELLSIRDAFLSKHIYKTYSGYVLSQFRRMKNAFENTGKFKTKHAMHLIRLLISGISALRDGSIMVDVSDNREMLLQVKSGAWEFGEIQSRALELDAEFQTAFDQTELPDQPDFQRVDDFLVHARRSMTDVT